MKVSDVMQRNVTTVSEDESLGLALQLMLWNEVKHVPVRRSEDGRVTGVISERDVLRANHAGGEQVLARKVRDVMSSPAVHIRPDADLADAAAELVTKRLGCLPVIEAGELVGIVTASDVAATLAQCSVRRDAPAASAPRTVTELMHPGPFLARALEPLLLAAGRMLRAGVRHLCVVDQDGKLIGILSDRDVRSVIGDPRTVLEAPRVPARLSNLTVAQAMTRVPRTLAPDDPVQVAIDVLLNERFGALPVVDFERRPLGIVSYVDVLREVAARQA